MVLTLIASAQEMSHDRLNFCGALVAVLPLIAAFVCLQRFWRSGLTAGAVK